MSGVEIGDRVRVRAWGDLLHEYGYVYRGRVLIDAPYKLSEEYKFVDYSQVSGHAFSKNLSRSSCLCLLPV